MSLNIIALEYGNSDSEIEDIETRSNKSEDTENVAATKNTEDLCVEQNNSVKHDLSYRNVVEVSSSEDSEDDSKDSDSSTDTSSSDESECDVPTNDSRKKETLKEKKRSNEHEYLPPIETLNISVSEVSTELLGKIQKIVEEVIVIEPEPDKPRLDIDSILFIDQGKQSLGRIFDVYGKVSEPYYCVRFNNSEHAQKSDIVGKQVYYCPDNKKYTSLIFLHELKKIKACDPIGDDEPPDFSSDEAEKAYYEQLSTTKKNSNGTNERPQKRRKMPRPAQNRKNSQANYSRERNNSCNNLATPYNFHFLPRYPYHSNTSIPPNMHPNFSHMHPNFSGIPFPRNPVAVPRFNYRSPVIDRSLFIPHPYMLNTHWPSVSPQSLFSLPPHPYLPSPSHPPLLSPSLPPCHINNSDESTMTS